MFSRIHSAFRNSRCIALLACLAAVVGAGCSSQPGSIEDGTGNPAQTLSANDLPADQLTPGDIRLARVRLASGGGGEGFHVAGLIQNGSETFTLTDLRLKVVLQDCLESGQCEVLAESVAEVSTELPAGQTTDFDVDADFGEVPQPKGTLGWHYAILDVQGAKP